MVRRRFRDILAKCQQGEACVGPGCRAETGKTRRDPLPAEARKAKQRANQQRRIAEDKAIKQSKKAS
jgi:hypothetical protein